MLLNNRKKHLNDLVEIFRILMCNSIRWKFLESSLSSQPFLILLVETSDFCGSSIVSNAVECFPQEINRFPVKTVNQSRTYRACYYNPIVRPSSTHRYNQQLANDSNQYKQLNISCLPSFCLSCLNYSNVSHFCP